MPLPFVASFLIVSLFPKGMARSRCSYSPATAWLLLFALSIMPFKFFDTYNRTSRIPSLLPVDLVAGQGLWDDLITEVAKISSKITVRDIITDSTTRFVLYSAVRGQAHRDSNYFPINNSSYWKDFRESDFSKHLLIINRRDGSITGSAHLSGHWRQNSLLVSNQYPDDIDTFLTENTDRFSLIWDYDRIRMFLVHY